MREVLRIDLVEGSPFGDVEQKYRALDNVFHSEPSPSQCCFDVQHYLLGFGAYAAGHKLTVFICSNLARKEQQGSDSCRFRKWVSHSGQWPLIKSFDFGCVDTGYSSKNKCRQNRLQVYRSTNHNRAPIEIRTKTIRQNAL